MDKQKNKMKNSKKSDLMIQIIFIAIFISILLILSYFFGLKKAVAIMGLFFSIGMLLFVIFGIGFLHLLDFKSSWLQRKCRIDQPKFRRFLSKQVPILRRLGFFEKTRSLSDEQLVEKLIKKIERKHGKYVGDFLRYPMLLASLDKTRVYWGDTECDFCKGNDAFVEILRDWAGISRGKFEPENMRETWSENEDSVAIEFELNGKSCCIHPKIEDDWLDPCFPGMINELISDTGYRFYIPECDYGQDYAVVFLGTKEKEILAREADWKFEEDK